MCASSLKASLGERGGGEVWGVGRVDLALLSNCMHFLQVVLGTPGYNMGKYHIIIIDRMEKHGSLSVFISK